MQIDIWKIMEKDSKVKSENNEFVQKWFTDSVLPRAIAWHAYIFYNCHEKLSPNKLLYILIFSFLTIFYLKLIKRVLLSRACKNTEV